MGSITSKLVYPSGTLIENFIISYLSRKGPTPYNMSILPGGPIKDSDGPDVIQHKFRIARKQQKIIREALKKSISPTRCLSPYMITDFDNYESLEEKPNHYSYTYVDKSSPEKKKSRSESIRTGRSSTSWQGLGNLRRLVTFDDEERVSLDAKKSHGGDDSTGQRTRSRSRSELDPRQPDDRSQTPSSNTISSESSSEAVVEKIHVEGKKVRKCWPNKETVRSVLKDKNRPTTYFLARFRPTSSAEYVEADYRFNQTNEEAIFTYKGPSLETLLPYEGRLQYQKDKLNNNLDESQIFLQNLPYFFNELDGRIWWNGYLIALDGPKSRRFQISKVSMNPPTLVLEMDGVQFVGATRTRTGTLTVTGSDGQDSEPIKTFQIKAKDENDLKQIILDHDMETLQLDIALPLLSGVPSSSSKLELEPKQEKIAGGETN